MQPRSFFSKLNPEKTKLLQTTVEWHTTLTPLMEQQIIQTHLASFLDLYRDFSEAQLGLPAGTSKKVWLTNMIQAELKDVKAGNILLATVSIENNVAGFITCLPVTHRHNKASSSPIVNLWHQKPTAATQWQDSIRKDAYISLLAVKPCRSSRTGKKTQIGLGRQLVESVEAKMADANSLTLDTRLINTPGIDFYKNLGFSTSGQRTFGGSDPDHYTGCEKKLMKLA